MYPGVGTITELYTSYYSYGGIDNSYESVLEDADFKTATHSIYINPKLTFMIAAGPFITIDISPAFTHGSSEYTRDFGYYEDTTKTWTFNSNIFTMGFGVNFVKRWYPMKMNIGTLIDFNYLNFSREYKKVENTFDYTMVDTTIYFHAFNIAYGGRAGAEILVNKHIGFNLDFLLLVSDFETFSNKSDYSDGTSDETIYKLSAPMIGLGAGVNFYF